MADDGFNASTCTFGGAAVGNGMRGIRYTEGGANPDVSGAEDTDKTYEGGLVDKEIAIDFVGTTTVGKNDKGAIVTAWNDGTSGGAIANAICTDVNYGGNMDGELLGTATFKPSTAAGS